MIFFCVSAKHRDPSSVFYSWSSIHCSLHSSPEEVRRVGPLCLRTNKTTCQAALTLRAYRLFDLRHFMCGSCHPPPHTPTTQRGMLYGLRHPCLPDAIIIYLHVLHAGFSIYRILSSDTHMCTVQLRKKANPWPSQTQTRSDDHIFLRQRTRCGLLRQPKPALWKSLYPHKHWPHWPPPLAKWTFTLTE